MIINKDRKKVYKKASKIWGEAAQLDMVQEECAELIQAISKWKRGNPKGYDKVLEEAADVFIMVEQVRCILKNDVEFFNIVKSKVERMESRLNNNTMNKVDS